MNFKSKKLKNGLTLITVPIKDNPAVTVLVLVEVGSNYESLKDNGLSHFLEHMVFKGTPRRTSALAISHELEGLGAHYNAFTGNEYTGYYAKVESKHFSKVLDIVSDIYLNPLFEQKEIDKEKGVIIEEIRMYNDLPNRKVHENLEFLLYGDQPAGRNLAGSEESVKSFTRKDFVRYRNEHYIPRATTIVVSGNINEAKVAREVEKIFGNLDDRSRANKQPVVESQNKPAFHLEKKDTDQTHIAMAFRTFPIADKRTAASRVLGAVLGAGMSSRLFQKLREEMGVCYYVRADAAAATDYGSFNISAGVDNSRVEEVVKVVLEECVRLKSELVSADELRRVKDYILGSTMLSLETSDALAEYYGTQQILKKKLKTPKQVAKLIESITPKQIQQIANEIFVKEHFNLALIGKYSDEAMLSTIANRVLL